MSVSNFIKEWARKVYISDEYFDEIKSALFEVYPTKEDFVNAKEEIKDNILLGFKQDDIILYRQSYADKKNIVLMRHRKKMQKRILRLYDKLYETMFNEAPEPEEILPTNVEPPPYPAQLPAEVVGQLQQKLSAVASQEEEKNEEQIVEQELDELPVCPICRDVIELNTRAENLVACHANFHTIHLMCRYDLATHNKHQCPICREQFEEDGGKKFCELIAFHFVEELAVFVWTVLLQ